MTKNEKLKVLVFIPTRMCGCAFSNFMDRVFKIILPYRKFLEIETKDSSGPLAEKYKINQKSIVICNPPDQEKPLIFSSTHNFKSYLELKLKNN